MKRMFGNQEDWNWFNRVVDAGLGFGVPVDPRREHEERERERREVKEMIRMLHDHEDPFLSTESRAERAAILQRTDGVDPLSVADRRL